MMRLSRLELLRYGKFSGQTLEFPTTGLDLHLVVGRNEAGKSTTRAALSELLFGIDRSTAYAFLHDYGNLRLGATLQDATQSLSIRRKKGNKNTLLDENDRPLQEQALRALLGNADRAFFERMFSLDHISLVAGAKQLLDAKDDVGRMLFQASFGLNRLGDLRRELDTEADLLWAPRRSKERAYFVAFDQYQSLGQSLENCTVRVKDYQAAEERVKVALEDARSAAMEQEQLARLCSRLERIRRTAPGLARRAQLLAELESLKGAILLPENASALLQEAQTQIARSDDDIARLESLRALAQKKITENVPNDQILRLSGEIRQLGERRHELKRFPEDLNKRKAEVQLLLTQIEELACELGWAKRPLEELKSQLPSAIALEGFEQLLQQHERLLSAANVSQSALTKRREELAELTANREASHDLGAPELLRNAVEEARRLGDVDARKKELFAPAELAKDRLLAAIAQLAPWRGGLAALRALAPPSEAELENLTQRFERLQKDEELTKLAVSNDGAKLKSLALQEEQVRRDASPVTRQQLEAVRQERDTQWRTLRPLLLSSSPSNPPTPELLHPFESAVKRTDELSDRRFDAATASATLQQLRAEIEQVELRLTQSNLHLQELEESRQQLRKDLSALTSGLNLDFEHPAKLRRWLELRRGALELGLEAERERLNLQQHEKGVAAIEQQLRVALETSKVLEATEKVEGFSALLRRAARSVTTLDEERARQKTLLEQQRKIERSITELEHQQTKTDEALENWKSDYRQSLQRFGLSMDVEPAAARLALNLMRDISARFARVGSIQKERIDTMTRDLAQFTLAVQDVVTSAGKAAIDVDAQSPFERINEMVSLLAKHEGLALAKSQAVASLGELSTALRDATTKRAQADANLKPLFEMSGTTEIIALNRAIESSGRKRELLRHCQDLERTLLEVGDGLTLSALEAEASSVDLCVVESQLTEHKGKLSTLAERRKQLDLAHADAERALAAIAGHADAAVAAAQRNEALASMTEAVERYLSVRTTSLLLKWAIERFRREKQGPLLSRASRLFGTLTLGQFEGLLVEYDDRDKPQLVGVREGGHLVALDGMSSGTTDQLYLALRIAALEIHLENGTPLPFIADDLFIHFDDDRSRAAFQVLAELAQRTQVLFFTHHDHLVEVAQQALNGQAQVTRL